MNEGLNPNQDTVGAGRTSASAGKTRSSTARKIVFALLAVGALGAIMLFEFRDLWNPELPSAELGKPVARAPGNVPPPIPATTQGTASVESAVSTTASSPAEKPAPASETVNMAAYLKELGITDSPKFERGALLRSFDFTRPVPPRDWPLVTAVMDDVEYVLFHGQSGTDEAVSYVAKLPLLKRLSLDGEPVTDKAIAFLKGHPVLERLDLAHTAISGAAIADLASIPNLTALDLRKTAVRGSCWKPLMRSRVSSLWLADNPIEDGELADLARDSSLSMVQLSNTRVTNAAIDILGSMPSYRQGDFADTKIDDAGVAKLSRLQNLVTLQLSGCPIAENGLAPLARLKKLRRLVIRNLALSDAALEGIAGCSQLEVLDLSGCRFNASGLRALSRLSMLQSLRIDGAKMAAPAGPAISRKAQDDLKRSLPNLLVEGTPQETPSR